MSLSFRYSIYLENASAQEIFSELARNAHCSSVGIQVTFYYPRPTLTTTGTSQQNTLLNTSKIFYENPLRISKFHTGK
jgi:hypothetical protein